MTWAQEQCRRTGLDAFERKYESDTGRRYPWLWANVRLSEPDEISRSLAREFPDVTEYIGAFPARRPGTLVLLAQRGHEDVFVHTDPDGYWGFRFYLANKHSEGLHFYMAHAGVQELPLRSDDWAQHVRLAKKHYARWPSGNRPFCLNSVRAAHAVDRNTCLLGERIACLMVPMGGYDEKRLLALLDESSALFDDYQLWYDRAAEDRAAAKHKFARGAL